MAFGKIKEDFLKQGINEFLKRLTPYTGMEIVELTPIEVKDDALIEKVLNDEAEKALSLIKPSDYVITMEIEGKNLSSEQFAEKSHFAVFPNMGVPLGDAELVHGFLAV